MKPLQDEAASLMEVKRLRETALFPVMRTNF